MKIKNLVIFLIVFSLILPSVFAAKVHGNIYGPYLEQLEDVVVSVDSVPKQTLVSRDGSYSFNLERGTYVITARHENKETYFGKENITITSEGDFNLDLILFEDLEADDISEDSVDIPAEIAGISSIWTYILIAWLVLIGVVLYMMKYSKYPHSVDLDDEVDEILKFIRQNKGRVTQMEIRKKFPWSEAKISLIITELEDKNLVRRVKKGRANVILLGGKQ